VEIDFHTDFLKEIRKGGGGGRLPKQHMDALPSQPSLVPKPRTTGPALLSVPTYTALL